MTGPTPPSTSTPTGEPLTLPCKSEHDRCTRHPAKDGDPRCKWRKQVDAGMREAWWVAEHKCETLAVRAEGFREVGDA